MKILVVNEHRAIAGGVETYLALVIPALLARGHQVMFLHAVDAQPGKPEVIGTTPGVPCIVASAANALSEVAAWKPDVIYAHGIADVTLEASLASKYPMVFFAHAYYGACISGTKRFAFPAVQACTRRLGRGCLAHYHIRRCGGLSPLTMVSHYRIQSRRRELLHRYAKVVVISRHMKSEYERQGLASGHVVLVPYAVEVATDGAPPGPKPRTDCVLFVGQTNKLKGGRALVEALPLAAHALGRPLRLVVAGDGTDRLHLEKLARRLGVSLELPGWVDASRRNILMRNADVLVVPSLFPEPFGLVGIEAGAVGLPAVGYAIGGIPDWLESGVSGELAPGDPPTVAGLADALVRALRDPEHLMRLRLGAWKSAHRHTTKAHLAALEAILASAADRSG